MGVISKLPSSQLLLFVVLGGNRSTGSPFVSLLYPISGALSIVSRRCAGQFCKKTQGAIAAHRAGLGLSKALSGPSAGYPSGGPFLVPPRKGERMRLKEALKGLLPQTKPSSLRILPARTWYREAGFRCFLRKYPSIQHIPCQCAHWRGIEDHFGFLETIAGGNRTLIHRLCRQRLPSAAFFLPFLAGQEAPRRRHPAESSDRASVRTPPALTGNLQLCIKSLSAASGRGKIFQKTQKRS